MGDERSHRLAATGNAETVSLLVRSFLRLGDRSLPRPRTRRIEPLRRSWVAAFWQARASVRAGIPLEDFLHSRFAGYVAALPVPRSRLPLAVEVDDGQIAVRAVETERTPAPDTSEGEAWLAPLVAVEGPAVRQEVAEHEMRLLLLDGEIDAARKRAAELSRRLAGDVSVGLVAAPPTVEATAEQMGRPPVRSAAPLGTAFAFAVAALVAETWQIALPLLRGAGIDAAAIRDELARDSADVAFVTLFALGVSAALFALAHAGLDAVVELARGRRRAEGQPDEAAPERAGDWGAQLHRGPQKDDLARRRWLAAGAGGAAAFSVLVACALASLGASADLGRARWTSVVLLLAVPLATELLLRLARREREERAQETAAALAWDRERAKVLSERERRLEELTWAEEEGASLERQRDAARRRLRDLSARASRAARLASEAELRERAGLSRLAQSLVGALELDRHEFIRQASAHGALELIASRRRKVAETRAALFDATPTTQAPPAVETGRVAS